MTTPPRKPREPTNLSGRAEAAIDRLHALYPILIDLGLDRLNRLLAALNHPERRLPPVLHVAGTNGKGSTCAFLRAITEAACLRTHVYTSPHLVRFNERIRLAGALVDDTTLAATLEEIEQINAGAPITVFEVLVAATFLLFARVPADIAIVEVGLGGRFDATNVVSPIACAIASISLDHQDFLGDTLARIAFEKAGIIKPATPCATSVTDPEILPTLQAAADAASAPLLVRNTGWTATRRDDRLIYTDAQGTLDLPLPNLPGPHQIENAGLAIATLRASSLQIPAKAWSAIAHADWPARLQRLHGRLTKLLPDHWELWLDGGHNPGAGAALAAQLATWQDRPLHLIVGMKQGKNIADFLAPLLPLATTIHAVREPAQHLAVDVDAIIAASHGQAVPGPTVVEALGKLSGPPARVLICGSLYLAGEVLKGEEDKARPKASPLDTTKA